MTRATRIALCALLLLVGSNALLAQQPGQFGLILYNGPTSADIYLGRLTDPQFTRVEFYRGAKKLGEITSGGPDGGIVTDNGLQPQASYTYEYRAYRVTGGFVQNTIATAVGSVLGGVIKGYLTRRDEVSTKSELLDSLFVFPEGEFLAGVMVPGGDFHLKPGAEITYDPTFAGKVLGIRTFRSSNPSNKPGTVSASGGILKDINIDCYGTVGPIQNLTIIATDITLHNDFPVTFNNTTFTWLTDQNRNDYAYVNHPFYNVTMTNCVVKNESTIQGVLLADRCIVEYDGIIRGKQATNCEFRNNGQLQLRPSFTPTSVTNSIFKSDGSVSLSNQSTVRYNSFESSCIITISSLAGFPPNAVDSIHVNFNEFQRDGTSGTIISIFQTDTIDLTKNYWGQCTGPSNSQRLGRSARFDPFLRVAYPRTSYWLDIRPSKEEIIANDEDEITFNLHFTEVLSGRDSVGATVNYLFRILGDTLKIGQLQTDASGRASITVKLPYAYKDAISLEAYFTSTQCIDKAFLIRVVEPAGTDLEVLDAMLVQSTERYGTLVAGKPFAIKAVIGATEAISSPFKLHAVVNGVVYDTFYVLQKQNIGVSYNLELPLTEIALPSTATPTVVIPIRATDIPAGPLSIQIIIDPPTPTEPKGRIVESNDNNNVRLLSENVVATRWGNDGRSDASIFVQAIDGMGTAQMNSLTAWTDSTKDFLERAWPMARNQIGFSIDSKLGEYRWIHPDTIRTGEDMQYYLAKAYKLMRTANPLHDRYVFAVPRDWFGTRLHPEQFPHRHSTTLTWSGIRDLSVTSAGSHWFLAHDLGHSFGLRRGDVEPTNEEQMEQYNIEFVGIAIYDGMDATVPRIVHAGTRNKADQIMKTHCFMGNSKLPNPTYLYTRWISDIEYGKLLSRHRDFTSFGMGSTTRAILIEGSIDSTTRAFDFGPWVKIDNAMPSAMADSATATHVFKTLDQSGNVLHRYFYTPTFTALGLDEVAEVPHFTKEHFAFVMPYSDQVKRIIVERNGTTESERVITPTAPVVEITYPTNGSQVPDNKPVDAVWRATDADGDQDFWYTVYFSRDKGVTWELLLYEAKNITTTAISAARGTGYQLKVIASDGVNSSETIVTFDVLLDAAKAPAPGSFALMQNYPNPFNPTTTLSYSIPGAGHVSLVVHDALGRPVRTIVDGVQSAGMHSAVFDASALPSGSYTAVLRHGDRQTSIRMTLAK